jgi:hypothetical protein
MVSVLRLNGDPHCRSLASLEFENVCVCVCVKIYFMALPTLPSVCEACRPLSFSF